MKIVIDNLNNRIERSIGSSGGTGMIIDKVPTDDTDFYTFPKLTLSTELGRYEVTLIHNVNNGEVNPLKASFKAHPTFSGSK